MVVRLLMSSVCVGWLAAISVNKSRSLELMGSIWDVAEELG
jgi:hypothetical protein